MVLRKLNLSEWFLRYQLLKMRQQRFYLPSELNIDITEFHRAYQSQGIKPPTTALLVKASALLFKEIPESHSILFDTLFGPRILQFSEAIINVPIILKAGTKNILSLVTIKNAATKSLNEIRVEIADAVNKPIDKYPIVHFVNSRKNNFFNRLLLRALHFIAYRLPYFYMKRGGGGFSVSSLLNYDETDLDSRPYAYGFTTYTICSQSVVQIGDRYILKLAIGWDHGTEQGNQLAVTLRAFSRLVRALSISEAQQTFAHTPTMFQDTVL